MDTDRIPEAQAYQEMWTKGKLEAVKRLRNPETAIFPDFDENTISREDCAEGEFVFDTYVDAHNERGKYVRARVRLKFREADRAYLGASFQKPKVVRRLLGTRLDFEWGPYEQS